ncbi:hypothetical protein EAH_00025130 [Eimeria acervulina]|uniref:Uncharacterized protein n=1 Tax=Eimeria acervulina TaxID=5801 RepID=U6GDF4_EIMAC|nr:hypothetical protein EAH_00025130 [Eimeria acervulina]CDI77542.1 hypothetical protein EAH_00025130 [Eimeria acervulina]
MVGHKLIGTVIAAPMRRAVASAGRDDFRKTFFTAVGASGEVAGVPAAGGADAAAYGTEGAKEARTADEIGDRTLADSRGAVGGLSSPSPVGPNVSRGTKGLGLFLAALLALIVGSLLHAAGSLDPQKPEPVLQPGQQPEQTDEDDETVEAGQRRREYRSGGGEEGVQ